MENEATTAISLYNAVGILDNIVNEQNEASNCHICHEPLDESFTICSVARGSNNNSHIGHSACGKCVETDNYIGTNGRCKACIQIVGTRPSQIAKAGIALIPAVKNKMSTDLVGVLRKAEKEISEIKDGQEQQRIQESVDRRLAAVEEVKKKRLEEEENANKMRVEAELEAKKIIEDAEKEAGELRTKAVRSLAENSSQFMEIVDKPKRKPMSEESLEKRRKTFADRKDKMEKFDQLANENMVLKQLLSKYVDSDEIDSMVQKSVFEV